jgi:hypothetical protein
LWQHRLPDSDVRVEDSTAAYLDPLMVFRIAPWTCALRRMTESLAPGASLKH